jgi:hypothetical protein
VANAVCSATVSSGSACYSWDGVNWDGSDRVPIVGNQYYSGTPSTTSFTLTLTPQPSAASPVSKRFTFMIASNNNNGPRHAWVDSVQCGANSAVNFVQAVQTTQPYCAADLYVIPVQAGNPVVINAHMEGNACHMGISMAFEN